MISCDFKFIDVLFRRIAMAWSCFRNDDKLSFAIKIIEATFVRSILQVRLSVKLKQLYTTYTSSSKHAAWRPDWLTLSERFIVVDSAARKEERFSIAILLSTDLACRGCLENLIQKECKC